MGRSQETYNKKENIKKREQKKKEKQARKENRQANSDRGKSLEDMMAYLDENGNLTTVKPGEVKKMTFKAEDIAISTPKLSTEEEILTGSVKYYNDQKGWGFIHDLRGERYFFLVSEMPNNLKADDKVHFKYRKGPRGLQAYDVEIG